MPLSKLIQLAPNLALPAEELATQITAALGMRGSGKSNVMAVIAEGLIDARLPVARVLQSLWTGGRMDSTSSRTPPATVHRA